MIKANILTKNHDDYIKNIFSTWLLGRPSWISHRNDFSYFLSTSHPDTSHQVLTQLAFYSGEVQNSFLRWQLWQSSCNSDWNDFSYFRSTSHLDDSCQVLSQLAFCLDFQWNTLSFFFLSTSEHYASYQV